MAEAGPAAAMRRTRATVTLYAALGCLGYVLTGLGVVLPELRDGLGLSRLEVALYPSAFAVGLLVVGAAGERFARALGARALPLALAALVGGALLLATGLDRALSGVGALVLGLGGAGIVQLVTAGLRAEHGDHAAVALAEANAASSTASVLAPLAVGAAIAAGLGWRAGYVAVPLTAAAVVVLTSRTREADPAAAQREPPGGPPPAFRARWADLLLVVAVEFCLALWAADFLRTEYRLTAAAASASTSLLVAGMALARAASSRITRRIPRALHLVTGSAVVTGAGFAALWAGGHPAVAATGLFIAGLGVALLYPVTIAEALAAWPAAPQRAAARAALASGLAIGAAPLLLGGLADALGLRTAMLLTPALLLAFLMRCALRLPG